VITQYRVWSLDGRHECVATTTSCTVKGLLDGVTYRFVVYAFNKIGRSPASAPSNAVSSPPQHGTITQSFSNPNPARNAMETMGTVTVPSNAASGAYDVIVAFSGCVNGPNGSTAQINVIDPNGTNDPWTSTNFSGSYDTPQYVPTHGGTFTIQSSCSSVTVEIDY